MSGTQMGSNIFEWITSKHLAMKLAWGILTISPLKSEPCLFVLFRHGQRSDGTVAF